jgi:hypothetical protein
MCARELGQREEYFRDVKSRSRGEEVSARPSTVTLGEVQAGVARTRSQDRQKASGIEHWNEKLTGSCPMFAMDHTELP